MVSQAKSMPSCSANYWNELQGLLAKDLVELMPKRPDGDSWVVYLCSAGSEAIDLAVQMAKDFTGHQEVVSLNRN